MCIISKLSEHPRSKVEQILNNLYLSDDEIKVINMILVHKSVQQIAYTLNVSERTVNRLKKSVSQKLQNIDNMFL